MKKEGLNPSSLKGLQNRIQIESSYATRKHTKNLQIYENLKKGRFDKDFLKKHLQNFDQFFYVCGPPEMVDSVSSDLKELEADPDKIVLEE